MIFLFTLFPFYPFLTPSIPCPLFSLSFLSLPSVSLSLSHPSVSFLIGQRSGRLWSWDRDGDEKISLMFLRRRGCNDRRESRSWWFFDNEATMAAAKLDTMFLRWWGWVNRLWVRLIWLPSCFFFGQYFPSWSFRLWVFWICFAGWSGRGFTW